MNILPVPYNLGAPSRNPKTREFPHHLEVHCKKFAFRKLSEDGYEHTLRFLKAPKTDDQKILLLRQLRAFAKLIKQDRTVCIVGGDNSLCYDFAIQFARGEKKPEKRFLISFDRHPDTMKASAKKASHATWLRRLIDECVFPARNVLIVGVGDAEKEELEYIVSKNIAHYLISEAAGWNALCHMPTTCRARLFVSLDVDVLGPSDLPGTGTRRGIGMGARDVLNSIKRIRKDFCAMPQAWCLTEAFHDPIIDPAFITLETVESLVREIAVEY